MKSVVLTIFIVLISLLKIFSQASCEEIVEYVKSKDSGITFYSTFSDAIRSVSFHEVKSDSWNTNYFAIVQFTSSFKSYIYKVNYDTKSNYSLYYNASAGEAFWKYIHPYRKTLGCAPELD